MSTRDLVLLAIAGVAALLAVSRLGADEAPEPSGPRPGSGSPQPGSGSGPSVGSILGDAVSVGETLFSDDGETAARTVGGGRLPHQTQVSQPPPPDLTTLF